MDPSAMDFMMHQDMHSSNNASSPTTSPNIDHTARSACPALRAAAERNQQSPMFAASRPEYRNDPTNPPAFWSMPSPYGRWPPSEFHQPTMLSMGMPPTMNAGQGSPPHYPPRGPEQYNPHMSPRSYYHTPIMSLTRIGGTAPTQHSQGNFSGTNQGQSQGGIRSGTANGLSGPGSQGGQGGPGTLMINSGIPGRQSGLTNGRLPSMNSVPPPLTNNNLQTQTQTYPQNSRAAQQSGRITPPPLPQYSTPAISLSMSETSASSPGVGAEQAPAQNDSSSSPSRRAPITAVSPRYAEIPDSGINEPRRVNTNRDRRGLTRLPSSESGWSSDDDSDPDAVAMSLLEAAVTGPAAEGAAEGRLRAQQVMRGSISTKRVASKKALTSLESVAVSSLPESERTCVICYNEYGAETPEGISEKPLRLPRCKHVFGDHCIRKWFEESDSCPYCRDRVPSEPQYRQAMNAHNVYRFLRQHHQMQVQMQTMRPGREHDRGDSDAGVRLESMASGFGSLASSPFAEYEYGAAGVPPSRRADGMSMYGSRTPAWHGNSGERHSPLPFNEIGENRRRVRPRHGSLRGFTPGRPHFSQAPTNNVPQPQQYSSWMHRTTPPHSLNRQNSVSGQNAASRTLFQANSPPAFPFQSAMGAHPHEPYPMNVEGSTEYTSLPHMRTQHNAPLSPTYAGPEVYMSNADETMYGGSGSHGQL
ncbi:uncharacterized protein GGS22DRAFT_196544 [Annulohypoxylon maeteangense]|uniref:uncharacterized protein n=1 Tax=Annulohypoxylon maeteangense TaxID=1927788 RepID=UPI0020072BC3|nr:uncharacterized protein GGS22DRAFT_196544 [Annulohypoxylon maeteangense]KAI0888642.1 hypothetical protein GGS22DRAFT_196544 [Annulohypoxylon maeteangense]